MSTLEQSRQAIDAFIEVGSQLGRRRRDKSVFEQLHSACEALLSLDGLDLDYLDAELRSRPNALNGLMSVRGGLLDEVADVLDDYVAQELQDWFEECEAEIAEHFAHRARSAQRRFDADDAPESIVLFRPAAVAPGRSAKALIGDFHFAYANSFEGRVLWDRRVFDIDYPAVSMLAMASLVSQLTFDEHVLPKWQPGPLFRYHPERFRQTRSGYLRGINSFRSKRQPPRTDDELLERLNQEVGFISQEINALSARFPLKGRQGQKAPPLDAEIDMFMLFDQFDAAGRQIFDLPPLLVEMFRNTDIENVPLDMLHSPYQSYFLHFGPQTDLELDGWPVDGAYVTHIPEQGLLQIQLVSRPTEDSAIRQWHSKAEPSFAFSFDQSTATMDVGMALDTVFAARLAESARQVAVGNIETGAHIEEASRALSAEGFDLSGFHVQPKVSEGAAERTEIDKRRFPIFREALRLVINSICYLTAYPEDNGPQWPDDTPASLREKATTGSDKEVKRAKSKLESLGFKAVHLCGQHFRRTAVGDYESTDRTVKRGWRRGHWLRQAYGERHSLRKLQWRMPTIVNRNRPPTDEPLDGHIYMVD